MNTDHIVSGSAEPLILELPGAVRRLGLIALGTDLASDRNFARLVPQDLASLHTARIAFENPTTPETLRRIQADLTRTADLILLVIPLDTICYSCAAASVVIGDAAIGDDIQGPTCPLSRRPWQRVPHFMCLASTASRS